ncbi:MAG: cell division protein SepF [Rothia sp. (in: high G+C Gram-positive bacteria)]|nr:cell division protein SepF [Rothia sp. (in: high G+C Gram-positive bacteria)]
MARTLHQAMAYLGLGQVEDEAPGAERHQRRPETVYEETVFDADDEYDTYPDDFASDESPAHIASSADRDVLLDVSSQTSRHQGALDSGAGSVSAAEAHDQLLEQAESTSADWGFPLAGQQKTSTMSSHQNPSFSQESSEELRRITTIKPRSYNDAKTVGESFRQNLPVIINITEMSEIDAKRLVDFSSGLAFALEGTIERVTDNVFLLSPADVEVIDPNRGKKQKDENQDPFDQA